MLGSQLVAGAGPRRLALFAVTACLAAALVMAVASAAKAAVPGAFSTLASSSESLTAVTSDPATGLIYAQGFGDEDFYSYDPATDRWTQLASAPIPASNDGGSTYLNGKIYVAYPDDGNDLGVYDIATNTWSTIPNPAGSGTGDITAVNGLLYLGGNRNGGTAFVSYDPASQTTTPLADSPGFTGTNSCDGNGLSAWGALAPFDGKIFAAQGNDCNGFAVYDIASNTWTQGPNVPDGVVMGGAVDPSSGTFYAYGDYAGDSDGSNHFYAYDIATNQWSTPPNVFPLGDLNDGGLTYVGTPGFQGIYAVEGENGSGFVRFSDFQDASVSESVPSGTTAGSPAVLSATVTNNGPAAGPISFTDTAAAGLSIEGAFAGGNTSCSVSGQQVTCTVSGLQPGQSAEVVIIVDPAAAGSYTSLASVATAAGISDPDSSNDSASATLQATAAPVVTAPAQTAPAQTAPAQTPAQTAPAQKCMVPNLRGMPVALARLVLSMTGCRTGRVTRVHSKGVRRGDVIKTLPKPGSYRARRAVALRLSSGPKPHHSKKAARRDHR